MSERRSSLQRAGRSVVIHGSESLPASSSVTAAALAAEWGIALNDSGKAARAALPGKSKAQRAPVPDALATTYGAKLALPAHRAVERQPPTKRRGAIAHSPIRTKADPEPSTARAPSPLSATAALLASLPSRTTAATPLGDAAAASPSARLGGSSAFSAPGADVLVVVRQQYAELFRLVAAPAQAGEGSRGHSRVGTRTGASGAAVELQTMTPLVRPREWMRAQVHAVLAARWAAEVSPPPVRGGTEAQIARTITARHRELHSFPMFVASHFRHLFGLPSLALREAQDLAVALWVYSRPPPITGVTAATAPTAEERSDAAVASLVQSFLTGVGGSRDALMFYCSLWALHRELGLRQDPEGEEEGSAAAAAAAEGDGSRAATAATSYDSDRAASPGGGGGSSALSRDTVRVFLRHLLVRSDARSALSDGVDEAEAAAIALVEAELFRPVSPMQQFQRPGTSASDAGGRRQPRTASRTGRREPVQQAPQQQQQQQLQAVSAECLFLQLTQLFQACPTDIVLATQARYDDPYQMTAHATAVLGGPGFAAHTGEPLVTAVSGAEIHTAAWTAPRPASSFAHASAGVPISSPAVAAIGIPELTKGVLASHTEAQLRLRIAQLRTQQSQLASTARVLQAQITADARWRKIAVADGSGSGGGSEAESPGFRPSDRGADPAAEAAELKRQLEATRADLGSIDKQLAELLNPLRSRATSPERLWGQAGRPGQWHRSAGAGEIASSFEAALALRNVRMLHARWRLMCLRKAGIEREARGLYDSSGINMRYLNAVKRVQRWYTGRLRRRAWRELVQQRAEIRLMSAEDFDAPSRLGSKVDKNVKETSAWFEGLKISRSKAQARAALALSRTFGWSVPAAFYRWKAVTESIRYTGRRNRRHLQFVMARWKAFVPIARRERLAAEAIQRCARGYITRRVMAAQIAVYRKRVASGRVILHHMFLGHLRAQVWAWKEGVERQKALKARMRTAMLATQQDMYDRWCDYVTERWIAKTRVAVGLQHRWRTIVLKRRLHELSCALRVQRLWRRRLERRFAVAASERHKALQRAMKMLRARFANRTLLKCFLALRRHALDRRALRRRILRRLLTTQEDAFARWKQYRQACIQARADVALALQKVYKARRIRMAFAAHLRRKAAAIVIQKGYRYMWFRRLQRKQQRWHAAARNIQRVYKGHCARVLLHTLQRHTAAATQMQRAARGFLARTGARSLRFERLWSYVDSRNYEAVQWALDNGLAEVRDRDGNSLLARAAVAGSKRVVKLCMRAGQSVNAVNDAGESALHVLARSSRLHPMHMELVQYLIAHGADTELRTDASHGSYTPLMTAIASNRNAVGEALVKYLADCNARDAQGKTAFAQACAAGNVHMVCVMLEHSKALDVGGVDASGMTPVHEAAAGGHAEVLDLLLQHGAHINDETDKGHTPLHLAALNDRLPIALRLVSAGAVGTVIDVQGHSAIFYAAMHGNPAMIAAIAENADARTLQVADGNGDTALHIAAGLGHAAAMRTLLQFGALVDAVNNHGNTAAHLASAGGQVDCVRAAVEYEANFNLRNHDGLTPLGCARFYGHDSVVSLLSEHFVSAEISIATGAIVKKVPLSPPRTLRLKEEVEAVDGVAEAEAKAAAEVAELAKIYGGDFVRGRDRTDATAALARSVVGMTADIRLKMRDARETQWLDDVEQLEQKVGTEGEGKEEAVDEVDASAASISSPRTGTAAPPAASPPAAAAAAPAGAHTAAWVPCWDLHTGASQLRHSISGEVLPLRDGAALSAEGWIASWDSTHDCVCWLHVLTGSKQFTPPASLAQAVAASSSPSTSASSTALALPDRHAAYTHTRKVLARKTGPTATSGSLLGTAASPASVNGDSSATDADASGGAGGGRRGSLVPFALNASLLGIGSSPDAVVSTDAYLKDWQRLRAEVDEMRRRTEAATTMQSLWRAYSARRMALKFKRGTVAAKHIQRVWRGYHYGRRELHLQRWRVRAATHFQRLWRGHCGRKVWAGMQKEKATILSAHIINRVYRGFRARQVYWRMRVQQAPPIGLGIPPAGDVMTWASILHGHGGRFIRTWTRHPPIALPAQEGRHVGALQLCGPALASKRREPAAVLVDTEAAAAWCEFRLSQTDWPHCTVYAQLLVRGSFFTPAEETRLRGLSSVEYVAALVSAGEMATVAVCAAQWEQPAAWLQEDRVTCRRADELRRRGYTREMQSSASCIQKLFRRFRFKAAFARMTAGRAMMKSAEITYRDMASPAASAAGAGLTVEATLNYALYLHTIVHDFDAARAVYHSLVLFMGRRGPDDALILYSWSLFICITQCDDMSWDDMETLLLRARKADPKERLFGEAQAGFFQMAVVLAPTNAWACANWALCLALLHKRPLESEAWFIKALDDQQDPHIAAAYTYVLKRLLGRPYGAEEAYARVLQKRAMAAAEAALAAALAARRNHAAGRIQRVWRGHRIRDMVRTMRATYAAEHPAGRWKRVEKVAIRGAPPQRFWVDSTTGKASWTRFCLANMTGTLRIMGVLNELGCPVGIGAEIAGVWRGGADPLKERGRHINGHEVHSGSTLEAYLHNAAALKEAEARKGAKVRGRLVVQVPLAGEGEGVTDPDPLAWEEGERAEDIKAARLAARRDSGDSTGSGGSTPRYKQRMRTYFYHSATNSTQWERPRVEHPLHLLAAYGAIASKHLRKYGASPLLTGKGDFASFARLARSGAIASFDLGKEIATREELLRAKIENDKVAAAAAAAATRHVVVEEPPHELAPGLKPPPKPRVRLDKHGSGGTIRDQRLALVASLQSPTTAATAAAAPAASALGKAGVAAATTASGATVADDSVWVRVSAGRPVTTTTTAASGSRAAAQEHARPASPATASAAAAAPYVDNLALKTLSTVTAAAARHAEAGFTAAAILTPAPAPDPMPVWYNRVTGEVRVGRTWQG